MSSSSLTQVATVSTKPNCRDKLDHVPTINPNTTCLAFIAASGNNENRSDTVDTIEIDSYIQILI